MRNTTKNSENRNHSKFLVQRRKSFLPKKDQPQNFNFVKQNQGSISASTISKGIIKCLFSSKATGKTAFAFGPTLGDAYQNMIMKFNLKYA